MTPTDTDLDHVLSTQLAVAWAGEGETDPPRLDWWRTSLCDEYGGEDLLRRLAPKTWRWAVLEAVRAAARCVDDAARRRADDADHLITLFRLGYETDSRLDERLGELKLGGGPPAEVFPGLAELTASWSRERFATWATGRGEAAFTPTATGRRLRGERPATARETVDRLTAALVPLSERYDLPHFRIKR